ncbi:3,4-dihydroxy-2-butanone-4-phosphate synthase, partial [Hyphomonas sp.]|uniref:3,4-dihydroxy-2-butanone-4-phosphate synthase n=1 Tax=Hyphomonas sp. TaxID=87 RepID=UPI00333FF073
DRSRTISVAIDPTKDHADIVTPGHVFPLIAKEGGTLVRAGHTEAAVDISRMAGLYPAGVICEIMNDDGTMARLPELVAFAQLHNLKIGTIADLIAWRRQNDRFLERRVEAPLNSAYGEGFRTVCFRNVLDGSEHIAIVHGDIRPDSLTIVRVHRTDVLADILGEKGPREGLVGKAMRLIAEAPEPGVVVFVNTMHPNALAERLGLKSAAPRDPTAPLREYGVGAQILRELGVRRMIYLSDTAPTRVAGLDGYGLTIDGWRRLNEEKN